jgi:hypothetical protein
MKAVNLCLVLASKGIHRAVQETLDGPLTRTLFRRLGTYSWGEGVHDSGTHGRRNRVPVKVEMVGCAVQLRWKGKRYAQATWLRLKGRKREDLTGSSQCVPAPGVGNANSGGLAIRPGSSVSGHSALATKSATVVV